MSGNYPTDDDTDDAASALTYLRIINDIEEAPDHPDAMQYLNAVQARTDRKEYISFVGVLKEFQEEIVREIDAKKEYVIKCALTLFQGQHDLIVGLAGYIPEILDALEFQQQEQQQQQGRNKQIASEWQQQEWRREPTTTQTALEWSQLQELLHQESMAQMASEWGVWQRELLTQRASELGKREWQQESTTQAVESDWLQLQIAASEWQQMQERGQEAMRTFIVEVRKRLQHSDQTACRKIEIILQEFLVNKTMPVLKAKKEMTALLQRHNDLWKEFEKFLPAEFRAGPSDAGPPANPL